MCLENTKQGFVLLESFRLAGKDGLDWDSMLKAMTNLSRRRFDSDRYVDGPEPLLSVLEESIQAGELELGSNELWTITPLGEATASILDREYVSKSHPEPS